MSTKDLIASNKDPNTKKVFKLAEETIRRIPKTIQHQINHCSLVE